MKELTNQEKIEIVEEARKRMEGELEDGCCFYRGICLWITLEAYDKGFLTYDEIKDDGYIGRPAQYLIPELLKIEPIEAYTCSTRFEPLRREGVPVRLQALEKLLEILKSNQHETL
ncbi:MAG: hypothetical protein LBG30_05835 [Odoribacteraceae bacterium]|jgi:hypothetical protein|nr:hypothetical protein [Odoribacteraceae bacterium]